MRMKLVTKCADTRCDVMLAGVGSTGRTALAVLVGCSDASELYARRRCNSNVGSPRDEYEAASCRLRQLGCETGFSLALEHHATARQQHGQESVWWYSTWAGVSVVVFNMPPAQIRSNEQCPVPQRALVRLALPNTPFLCIRAVPQSVRSATIDVHMLVAFSNFRALLQTCASPVA
jgi:hypothetical protein